LHFWTDVLDYFQQTIELIAEFAPELGVPIPTEELPAAHDLDYRTHFERRSRKHQIPVYRVRFEKRTRSPQFTADSSKPPSRRSPCSGGEISG
jgi:tRNA (guanine-N7-)-methyltransferase